MRFESFKYSGSEKINKKDVLPPENLPIQEEDIKERILSQEKIDSSEKINAIGKEVEVVTDGQVVDKGIVTGYLGIGEDGRYYYEVNSGKTGIPEEWLVFINKKIKQKEKIKGDTLKTAKEIALERVGMNPTEAIEKTPEKAREVPEKKTEKETTILKTAVEIAMEKTDNMVKDKSEKEKGLIVDSESDYRGGRGQGGGEGRRAKGKKEKGTGLGSKIVKLVQDAFGEILEMAGKIFK